MLSVNKALPLIVSAKNPIGWSVYAGANWLTTSSELVLRIERETAYMSQLSELVTTTAPFVDGDGNVLINLQPLVAGLVRAEPIYTNNPTSGAKRCVQSRWRFIARLSNNSSSVFAGWCVLLRGGVSPQEWRRGEDLRHYVSNGLFLTRAPITRYCTPNMPMWLHQITPYTGGILTLDYELKAELFFADGSSTIVTGSSIVGANGFDVLCWPVGYKQLNIQAETRTVVKYDVWVENSSTNTRVTERRTFVVDRLMCGPLDRYYVFENPLGGWDTLHTSATLKQSGKVGDETVVTPNLSRFFPGRGPEADFGRRNVDRTPTYRQHISHRSFDEASMYVDLLESEHVYRLGGVDPNLSGEVDWQPIQVTNTKYDLLEDNVSYKDHYFDYIDRYDY